MWVITGKQVGPSGLMGVGSREMDGLNFLVLLGVVRPALKTKWNSLSGMEVACVACSCV